MGTKKIKRSQASGRKAQGRKASGRKAQGRKAQSRRSESTATRIVTAVTGRKPYSPRPGTVPGWIYRNLAERPMLFGELSVHVGRETGMSGDNLASQLSASLRDLVVRGAIVRLHHDTNKPVTDRNARGALYSLVPAAKAAYLAAKKGQRRAAASVAVDATATRGREIFGGAAPKNAVPMSMSAAVEGEGTSPFVLASSYEGPTGPQGAAKQLDLSSFAGDAGEKDTWGRSRDLSAYVGDGKRPRYMPIAMYAQCKDLEKQLRIQLEAVEAVLNDPRWS